MPNLTGVELDAIEKRCAAAYRGPCKVEVVMGSPAIIAVDDEVFNALALYIDGAKRLGLTKPVAERAEQQANAELMASAFTDLPRVVADLREARNLIFDIQEATAKLCHWHDWGKANEGMVVCADSERGV